MPLAQVAVDTVVWGLEVCNVVSGEEEGRKVIRGYALFPFFPFFFSVFVLLVLLFCLCISLISDSPLLLSLLLV